MCWLGIWTLEVNVKPVIASHDCVTEFATKLALRSVTSMTVARVLATSTRASSALRCVLIVEGVDLGMCSDWGRRNYVFYFDIFLVDL